MDYYVYIYYDPTRNNQPFYVGKGKGPRAWFHLYRSDTSPMTHRVRHIKKVGSLPVIGLYGGMDEELALLVEEETIRKFGRRDLGQGTLLNLTDGGSSGPTGFNHSEQTKLRISEYGRANPKRPWQGKSLSPEHRAKIAAGRTYKGHSQEVRDRISASKTGVKRGPYKKKNTV